ncbi:EAL domain-containing protein [Sulfurimonas aquatica]|uniref:EAL domain-containing protein n=1 Tax=Sulfurimonas aquatica TaxID=2672570 RepID=A0A975B2S5_9BACT|nr:bifunctional diguanylate cyclase/phosphodiesterase [Sulfurimonas aquatica]QSZ43093.1 EAL domain-containing protein [Sulfurimonas aquatica]
MNENLSFYKFMHKQILVIIVLNVLTAPGYLLMGYIYTSMLYEFLWMLMTFVVAIYGYYLYKEFNIKMTLGAKDRWLNKVRYFMFTYSSTWSIMFYYYVMNENIEMHYIAISTQLGTSVVAATLLASQRKLVVFTVSFLMMPLILYFLFVGEAFSYILSFFTFVLGVVLLYAAKNTNDYILKSNYQAYHDHLTNIGNRRYFLEILESSVRENNDKYTYLLLIDLDYFKTINDTLGHDVGDELLKEVAKRMVNLSDKHDNKVARLGGDEFCILSSDFNTQESCLDGAKTFSTELLKEIKNNYNLNGNHLYISASIGVSVVNTTNIAAAEYLKEADMAMYEAKHNGRDGIIVFNEELCELVQRKLDIERLLHFALEKDEISLVYQPQIDEKNLVVGCEVLVRWHNEKLGFVPPDIFIPIAENTGFIIELGEYILYEAFQTIKEWDTSDLGIKQVSINISMRQLMHQDFLNTIQRAMKKYFRYGCEINIIFEITETSASDDYRSLVRVMNILKRYGITFSMDDFGTGYSSLSYLRELPIEELKIDKSFISQLADVQQASLVKTIVDIAKNLNLTIVAEGVEEEYQREYLQELDCDLYQGYLYSKPIKKEEFENFCRK